ncbi:hypothetical protein [Burkholderia ubonensis]|uniref:hypothetical protein n=1 Tax=Burkholderia ubonensis TaxID=101571 RepID=UPI000A6034DC|nr:hypothetical protein [Burkholderia ubonensis]
MSDSNREEYIIVLSYINSISHKVKELEARGEAQKVRGDKELDEELGEIKKNLINMRSYLEDLRSRKSRLESLQDLSKVELMFNDALKVESLIKEGAKKAYREMSKIWTAISHPAFDPIGWLSEWIGAEARLFGVVANAGTEVLIQYSVPKSNGLRATDFGVAESRLAFKKFTLLDIVTNRYLQDTGVKSAHVGTVSIQWNKSYPQGFIDRLTSGAVAFEHEEVLSRHLAKADTIDCIAKYFHHEMVALAQAYLATMTNMKNGGYSKIMKDFVAGRLAAKPVYVGGEILDRMFLIPAPESAEANDWGVLCSIADKELRFLELPRSMQSRIAVVEKNDAWLRRHLPLSKRASATFTQPLNTSQIVKMALRERIPAVLLRTRRSLYDSNETRSPERIVAENYIEVVRSNMDFITTTNGELWADWFVEKASVAGLVVSLALVPAAMAGVPHMLAAGLMTTAVTAVLPNVAKILVNNGTEKQGEAVKEILLALTLEAIGYGISKAIMYAGATIARNSSSTLASQTMDGALSSMRNAIENVVGKRALSIVPSSVGENLDGVLNYIDDLDIALDMTRNYTETMVPWHNFGADISNAELDAFLLRWGAQNAKKASEFPIRAKLVAELIDPLSSTGAKIEIDSSIDRGDAA